MMELINSYTVHFSHALFRHCVLCVFTYVCTITWLQARPLYLVLTINNVLHVVIIYSICNHVRQHECVPYILLNYIVQRYSCMAENLGACNINITIILCIITYISKTMHACI